MPFMTINLIMLALLLAGLVYKQATLSAFLVLIPIPVFIRP